MYLRPETISLYNCIFSYTVRIYVFVRSPVAHDLILPNVCARRAYPRRFLGRVGRTPLSPTLTWRRFQMPSRKGVLNRLYSTDAYQCIYPSTHSSFVEKAIRTCLHFHYSFSEREPPTHVLRPRILISSLPKLLSTRVIFPP